MSNTSKQPENETTRTGGNVESRDSSSLSTSSASADVERTGGNVESRNSEAPTPPPSTDVERTGGS